VTDLKMNQMSDLLSGMSSFIIRIKNCVEQYFRTEQSYGLDR